MKVCINSKETEIRARSLSELATELDLPAKGIAVAVSNKVVPRSDWDKTPIEEGAVIVIIKAVCGG